MRPHRVARRTKARVVCESRSGGGPVARILRVEHEISRWCQSLDTHHLSPPTFDKGRPTIWNCVLFVRRILDRSSIDKSRLEDHPASILYVFFT